MLLRYFSGLINTPSPSPELSQRKTFKQAANT